MGAGKGDQRRQPPEKIRGFQEKMGGSLRVGPGTPQAIDDLAVGATGETLLGEGSPETVPEQPLKGLTIEGGHGLRIDGLDLPGLLVLIRALT
jgi:hypothetical protein